MRPSRDEYGQSQRRNVVSGKVPYRAFHDGANVLPALTDDPALRAFAHDRFGDGVGVGVELGPAAAAAAAAARGQGLGFFDYPPDLRGALVCANPRYLRDSLRPLDLDVDLEPALQVLYGAAAPADDPAFVAAGAFDRDWRTRRGADGCARRGERARRQQRRVVRVL